jgi:hypothetical protein
MPWPLILLTPDDFAARLDLTSSERLQLATGWRPG